MLRPSWLILVLIAFTAPASAMVWEPNENDTVVEMEDVDTDEFGEARHAHATCVNSAEWTEAHAKAWGGWGTKTVTAATQFDADSETTFFAAAEAYANSAGNKAEATASNGNAFAWC